MFSNLNPSISTERIDFEANVDESLHMDENIEKLQRAYPQYTWRAEGEEDVQRRIREEQEFEAELDRLLRDYMDEFGIT